MSIWSIWTNPQATIDLKQCIADGISANDTATILSKKYGPLTRSACIGRAFRLKVKFCSELHHRKPRMRKKYARFKTAAGSPIDPRLMPSFSQVDQNIPADQRKQLLELSSVTCRYPVGDLKSPEFFFCGAPEADNRGGHPYCARHSQVAFAGNRKSPDISPVEAIRHRRQSARLMEAAVRAMA